MSNVIQWKQGSKFTGSANAAYAELEKIRKKEGSITPGAVYRRAKEKSNPLHRHVFDCPSEKAAERYYIERARNLIRSVEIIHVEKPEVAAKAYSVVTVPSKDDKPRKVYTSTQEALQDPVQRDEILANAIRDALAYRRKYAGLQELAKVFTAMDELVENLSA